MQVAERIEDIVSTYYFYKEELYKHEDIDQFFSAPDAELIVHFTKDEFRLLDSQMKAMYEEMTDVLRDTKKGLIYIRSCGDPICTI